MKFKVLRGVHVEGGRIYESNSIVDSETDLVRLFKNKFERVDDLDVDADQPNVEHDVEVLGTDVTDKFDEVDGLNVRVYRDGRRYFVVDASICKAVHDTPLTSMHTVRRLLKGLADA